MEKKKQTVFVKVKRVLAVAGVVIILGLYIATLVLAVLVKSSETARMMFRAALASTVMIPVFLYVVIWLHGVLSKYRYYPEETSGKEAKEEEEKENSKQA